MKSRGFTLIELLVVISIISLLSSTVISSLNDARLKAKNAAIHTSISQWRNAITAYYNQNGSHFDTNWSNICLGSEPCYIGDFNLNYSNIVPNQNFISAMSPYMPGTPNPNRDFVRISSTKEIKSYFFGQGNTASLYWFLYGDVSCGFGALKFAQASGNTQCALNI
jgi:prepilin-type N-terminal cleavage/methylation domain-containing protein